MSLLRGAPVAAVSAHAHGGCAALAAVLPDDRGLEYSQDYLCIRVIQRMSAHWRRRRSVRQPRQGRAEAQQDAGDWR